MRKTPAIWIGGGLLVVLGAVSVGLLVAREARVASSAPAGGSERSAGGSTAGAGQAPTGVAGSSRSPGHETPPPRSAVLPVSGVEVSRGPFVMSVRASGRAEARRRVELFPRVTEHITAVHVTEGDAVAAGELLVELDSRSYDIALREAEARQATAEVDYQVNLLDDPDAADNRRTLAAHRSGLTEAAQQLARARVDRESTRITAPFAGDVTAVSAEVGGLAQGAQPLVTLVDIAAIRVPAEVLERDFGRLRAGALAEVRFTAFPDEIFHGTVSALSPECDPEDGTGIAYIEIQNPDRRLRPGMYAEVTIEADRLENRLAVPRRALLERDRKLLVFRASGGRAEWQYVDIGLESEDAIEITRGLAPGDTILVDGHLTLAHGAPVRVKLVGE